MPELPEVEVVKRSLEKTIINLTIKSVKIIDGDLRYKVKKQDINKIAGSRIDKIVRRSKYLLFFFDTKFMMMAHLGMTGKFFIVKKKHIKERTSFYYRIDNDNSKHDRLLFVLNKNIKLIYNDVRKFGFIKILLKDTIDYNQHLRLLGPEPLSNFFNFKYFKDYLVGRKRKIKDLLMDQKFIAGLGNIYVNEILFLCKIKPLKNVDLLKDKEIRQIIRFSKSVIKKAIRLGGSSINNFSDTVGKKGNFQQLFNVYGKKGNKCVNSDCRGVVKKIVISNRASFFCSICQK